MLLFTSSNTDWMIEILWHLMPNNFPHQKEFQNLRNPISFYSSLLLQSWTPHPPISSVILQPHPISSALLCPPPLIFHPSLAVFHLCLLRVTFMLPCPSLSSRFALTPPCLSRLSVAFYPSLTKSPPLFLHSNFNHHKIAHCIDFL